MPEPVQIERGGRDRVAGGADGDGSKGMPLCCRCCCRGWCGWGWRRRRRCRGGCSGPWPRLGSWPWPWLGSGPWPWLGSWPWPWPWLWLWLGPWLRLGGRVGHRDPYHRSAGAAQFGVRPLVSAMAGGAAQGDPLVVPHPVHDGRRRRPPIEHGRDGSAARARVAGRGVEALAPTGRAAHRHALGHGPIVLLRPPLVRLLTTFASPLTLLPDSRKYFPHHGSERNVVHRWKGSPRGATGERIRQLEQLKQSKQE